MPELTDDLKQTVTRLLEIQQTRTELDAEEKHLKTIVRTSLTIGEKGTVNGQPIVTLTPNRRFSTDLAQQILPPDLVTLCTVSKFDPATAKKTLPPAFYEQCMAEIGDPIVRLV